MYLLNAIGEIVTVKKLKRLKKHESLNEDDVKAYLYYWLIKSSQSHECRQDSIATNTGAVFSFTGTLNVDLCSLHFYNRGRFGENHDATV